MKASRRRSSKHWAQNANESETWPIDMRHLKKFSSLSLPQNMEYIYIYIYTYISIISIFINHSLIGVRSLEFPQNRPSPSAMLHFGTAIRCSTKRLVSSRGFATPLCLPLDYLGDQKMLGHLQGGSTNFRERGRTFWLVVSTPVKNISQLG